MYSDDLPTTSRGSAYVRLHEVADVGVRYDRDVYAAGSHDEFLWSLERPLLLRLASARRDACGRLRYLDFACGTGRILSTVEVLADEAYGVDISPHMVDQARPKVRAARLVVADVLEDPDAVDRDFDLVTAFRFFLNTEDGLRQPVMAWLASRLAGPDARLIFHVHGNASSTLLLTSLYMRLRGWGSARLLGIRRVRELTSEAGLVIEAAHGFGLFPRRLHRGLLRRPIQAIERMAAGSRWLRPLSHDVIYVCRRA